MNKQATRKTKPYDELKFSDRFMFGKVMGDKELCRDVLECLLQQPVGELTDPVAEREVRHTSEGKYIRLDVYTRDEDTVYDAEMQNLNKQSLDSLCLPRRTRFYQSSIDMDHLDKGGNYRSLPESTILFICTFDPFEKGLSQYTFAGICREDPNLTIGDGTVRIFYNCSYEGDDIPAELKELYEYIETGKSGNALTERIDGAVKRAREVEEWRSQYMYYDIDRMDAIEEGRELGRSEERAKTESERNRADAAEARADDAEARAESEQNRADAALAELAKYKEKFGVIV